MFCSNIVHFSMSKGINITYLTRKCSLCKSWCLEGVKIKSPSIGHYPLIFLNFPLKMAHLAIILTFTNVI